MSTYRTLILVSLSVVVLFAGEVSAQYRADYTPGAIPPLTVDQTATVTVKVTNTGSATWNSAGLCAVVLGSQWYQGKSRVAADPLGTPLPNSVAPGQSVELTATIVAPSSPGPYTLAWDMRAKCDWFTNLGAPPGTQNVQVLPKR